MPKTKKISADVTKPFVVTLKVNDKVHRGEGDTMLEALKQIVVTKVTTKGVFEIFGEGKTKTFPMYVTQLRRLLVNDFTKTIWAKRMLNGLK